MRTQVQFIVVMKKQNEFDTGTASFLGLLKNNCQKYSLATQLE